MRSPRRAGSFFQPGITACAAGPSGCFEHDADSAIYWRAFRRAVGRASPHRARSSLDQKRHHRRAILPAVACAVLLFRLSPARCSTAQRLGFMQQPERPLVDEHVGEIREGCPIGDDAGHARHHFASKHPERLRLHDPGPPQRMGVWPFFLAGCPWKECKQRSRGSDRSRASARLDRGPGFKKAHAHRTTRS